MVPIFHGGTYFMGTVGGFWDALTFRLESMLWGDILQEYLDVYIGPHRDPQKYEHEKSKTKCEYGNNGSENEMAVSTVVLSHTPGKKFLINFFSWHQ